MTKKYYVYKRVNDEWELFGIYKSVDKIAKDVRISQNSVFNLLNGIYTMYQDKYKVVKVTGF